MKRGWTPIDQDGFVLSLVIGTWVHQITIFINKVMEMENVLVYGLVNVREDEFIPNQAEIMVIFHGGMSWLFCSLKVGFIWSQFLKGFRYKIYRFGRVCSPNTCQASQQSRRTWGMWILRGHTWDNYRDGLECPKIFFLVENLS